LSDYDPGLTDQHIRLRDLMFFFNKLDSEVNSFDGLRVVAVKAGLRKKFMISFCLFLIFLISAIFSLQLTIDGELEEESTILIIIGLSSAALLNVFFIIINHNKVKIETKHQTLEIAHKIKNFLERDNFFWMIKKFIFFDIDRELNVYVIFLERNETALRIGVNKESLREYMMIEAPQYITS
jgi:hypothetical protein